MYASAQGAKRSLFRLLDPQRILHQGTRHGIVPPSGSIFLSYIAQPAPQHFLRSLAPGQSAGLAILAAETYPPAQGDCRSSLPKGSEAFSADSKNCSSFKPAANGMYNTRAILILHWPTVSHANAWTLGFFLRSALSEFAEGGY